MKNREKEIVDFIGVGAQKAGTTWLNNRLDELPDISVPPIKEIHYFDRSPQYPSPNTHAKNTIIGKITTYSWVKRIYKRLILPLFKGNINYLNWKSHYFFKKPTDEWYKSLFENMDGISGEITPSYSILSINDLKHIKKLFPSVRIILLLRNPIDRAWSHYRYSNKPKAYNNTARIKRFINSKEQTERSDYINILNNYRSVFNEEQLYISFYDRIVEDPENLLTEIVNFIGGNADNIENYCRLSAKSNVSAGGEIPNEALRLLQVKYKPCIEKLAKEFGSYPEKWRKKHYGNTMQSTA